MNARPPRLSELADLPPGFSDPVQDAQVVFRALLEAMARPGRAQASAEAVVQRIPSPAGVSAAAAAILLTVADADVRLWLDPALAAPLLAPWLRFHTGAQLVTAANEADWLVLPAASASPALWAQAGAGTDEAPHRSATLLIDAPQLDDSPGLTLRGPGIEFTHALGRCGLPEAFWQARIASEADFPRGADLVLACGDRWAALPRSTRLTLEA